MSGRRVDEPAPPAVRCWGCGAAPEARRDSVAPAAQEYLCSSCFSRGLGSEENGYTGRDKVSKTPPWPNPAKPLEREGKFFTTRRRGGRPRLPDHERRQRKAARQRVWRERKRLERPHAS